MRFVCGTKKARSGLGQICKSHTGSTCGPYCCRWNKGHFSKAFKETLLRCCAILFFILHLYIHCFALPPVIVIAIIASTIRISRWGSSLAANAFLLAQPRLTGHSKQEAICRTQWTMKGSYSMAAHCLGLGTNLVHRVCHIECRCCPEQKYVFCHNSQTQLDARFSSLKRKKEEIN